MTENELEARVLQMIHEMHLLVHLVPDSQRIRVSFSDDERGIRYGPTQLGWPDLTIVGRRRVLFRELKTGRGVLLPPQVRVRDYLRWAHADWAIWQPRDLRSGRIEDELGAIA